MNLVHALNDTFLIRPVVSRRSALSGQGDPLAADKEGTQSAEVGEAQGVFVDPKTLASFPVAAAVVTTVTQVVVKITNGSTAWIALVVALVIGALIVAITMTDVGARPKTKLEWIITLVTAAINSLLLYAAVVGIQQISLHSST